MLAFLAVRLLGPVSFGEYSAAFAFTGLFRILPDFGMSYASTLTISRDPSGAPRLLGNLIAFQAVLSIATVALCLGIGRLLFDGVTWSAVVILTGDLVLKAVQTTLRWVLKGFSRFGAEALALLGERALICGLAFLALVQGYGVIGFTLAFVVVRLVVTVLLYGYVHARVVRVVPARDGALWLDLFKKGLPFAYAGAVITLFFQVDAVMLEQMRGALEVGWYSAPVRILEGLTLVPRILGYAFIPTMAVLHTTEPHRVTQLFRRGTRYLLLVGLPVAAFGLLESDRFVPLLFTSTYMESVPAARILIPTACLMFLSNFAETTLACIDRWRSIVIASTVALAVNVALNLTWIPVHGYIGAAWATLLTEGTYFVLLIAALAAQGHRVPWLSTMARPLLATAIFTAVLWSARGLPLVIGSTLASLAFLVAAIVVALDTEERALATKMLSKVFRR